MSQLLYLNIVEVSVLTGVTSMATGIALNSLLSAFELELVKMQIFRYR